MLHLVVTGLASLAAVGGYKYNEGGTYNPRYNVEHSQAHRYREGIRTQDQRYRDGTHSQDKRYREESYSQEQRYREGAHSQEQRHREGTHNQDLRYRDVTRIPRYDYFQRTVPPPVTMKPPPPEILDSGAGLTVTLGSPITLNCNVKNMGTDDHIVWKHFDSKVKNWKNLYVGSIKIRKDPNLDIELQRKSLTISQPREYQQTYTHASNLIIKNITTEFKGNFSCEVIYGENTTRPIQYEVTVLVPPTVESDRDVVVAEEGSSTSLTCQAKGHPTPTITWTKEKTELDHTVRGSHDSDLKFDRLSRSDAGIYLCRGDNGVGNPDTAKVNLVVNYAPDVTPLEPEVFIDRDGTALVTCVVKGVPTPQTTWSFNSQPIRWLYHSTSNISHETLVLRKVSKDKVGNYTCHATNPMGDDKSEVLLSGRPSRVRITSLDQPTLHHPTEFNLTWTLNSFATVKTTQILFRKADGRRGDRGWKELEYEDRFPSIERGLRYQHNFWKKFRDLEAGTRYQVKLKASNDYGWSQFSPEYSFTTRDQSFDHSRRTSNQQQDSPNRYSLLNSSSRSFRDPEVLLIMVLPIINIGHIIKQFGVALLL